MNIEKLRAETPGCKHVIHLDNAGAALMPQPVVGAMQAHIEREAAVGGYVAAEERAGDLDAVYASLGALVGARPAEIAITGSATDAWDRAFYSLGLGPGDRIVTAFNEYCANFVAFLHLKKRLGIEIAVVGPDPEGEIDLEAMESELAAGAALLAISHVPSTSGQTNPVAEIGRMANRAGVPYLLDACQSVGQLKVDVSAIGCQMMSATGRKFLRGPRAIGFLYVARDFRPRMEPVFMTNQGGDWVAPGSYEERMDARVFEVWERSAALQLGLGAAADYFLALDGDWARKRISALAGRLRAGLAEIPGLEVHDVGRDLCGIVTFTSRKKSPDEIKDKLFDRGVVAQVARVRHTRLDLEARGIEAAVRLSPHYYLLEAEIDHALEEIAAL